MSKPAAAKRYTFLSPMSVGIALTAPSVPTGIIVIPRNRIPHIRVPTSSRIRTMMADTGGYTITRKQSECRGVPVNNPPRHRPSYGTLIERARNEAAAQSTIQIVSSRRAKTQAAA